MRLGNLGLMFGAVLIIGAAGCRHGNEDRGTTASRSDQGYPQGNTSNAGQQSSGYNATGGTGGYDRYGNTDNYGSSAGTSGSTSRDQTGNQSRSGSDVGTSQGNYGNTGTYGNSGSSNDMSGSSSSGTSGSMGSSDSSGSSGSYGNNPGASNPSGMGSNQLTGDAVVNFTTKSSNQNLTGMAAFTSQSNGLKLVVDVNNAIPGRYNIILRQDGACDMSGANYGTRGQTSGSSGDEDTSSGYGSDKSSSSSDLNGSPSGSSGEDQSSSGYRSSSSSDETSSTHHRSHATGSDTSGSKSAMHKRTNLGQFTVDSSGHGHFEQTFTERQINNQSVSALENQALVLKQQSQGMSSNVGSRGQAAACGIITLSSNRTPAS